jgi:DNA-binding transcriptional LysR family regulator
MDLGRLKAFLTVARKGNLSSAAKELGMTQPNLGRQMTALAKEVEMDLFARHSRGMELTQRGKEFFDLCQRIVGELDQETAVIREKDSEPQGCLRIITGIGSTESIIEKLYIFSQKFPKISFLFSSITDTFRFQIGAADVGMIPVATTDPDLIQYHLFDMDLRFYAAPKYLEENPAPKSYEDLKAHRLIIYTGDNNEILKPLNIQINDILQKIGVGLDIYEHPFIGVNNGINMRTALIKGYGIGSYAYDRELIEKNLLVDVFPDMPEQRIPYYFTYHKRLDDSPKIKEFYLFLKELCQIWHRPS